MKSTLKVHNPRVIILLICINDVQGKELSFKCVILLTDGCLEGLKLMHTLENIQQPSLLACTEPF